MYGSDGVPDIAFVGIVLLVVWAGGLAFWRMNVARRIAVRNGLDPREASTVALLDEGGLAAGYLRSGLQRPPAGPPRTPQQRLDDLEALRTAGKITEAEYAAARKRIIDSL